MAFDGADNRTRGTTARRLPFWLGLICLEHHYLAKWDHEAVYFGGRALIGLGIYDSISFGEGFNNGGRALPEIALM